MRPRWFPLTLALVAACLGSAAAQDDVATEARLLAVEGKFREADALVENAAPEVCNDVGLRLALAETAMRAAQSRKGDDRRDPLVSARRHFAKVVELQPAEVKAAVGVLDASKALTELHIEMKRPDDARIEAKAAIEAGEKALAGGVAAPEFKASLGRMYAFRASFTKSMKDVDMLVADSTKAGSLLADAAAAGREDAARLYSEASAARLNVANLVHEGIPRDEEKRDDAALSDAIDLATKACNAKGAEERDFATHLEALRLAHVWGLKLEHKPFMSPLGPPLEGLTLMLPRSGGWNRTKAADWDLVLERNLHDPKNDGTVQIMFRRWMDNDMTLGKPWGQIDEIAPRRFDKYKEDMTNLGTLVEPVKLSGRGKNAPVIWHYQVTGQTKQGRTQRIAEWIWHADKEKSSTWQMKILDWRPVPDVEDPDLVAFVASAIGEGLWPPGSAPPAKDPKGKKPPTKKK